MRRRWVVLLAGGDGARPISGASSQLGYPKASSSVFAVRRSAVPKPSVKRT